jgi:hypothetical protein
MKTERISAKEYNQKYGSIFKAQKSKYNNKKTLIDDKKFDSASEGDLYFDLKMQMRQGLIADFKTQAKEEMWAYGVHICDYYVDFLVIHNDGTQEFIEHKSTGTVSASWRIKYKMLEAKYKEDKSVKISTNWYRGYKIIKRKKAA